MEKFAVNPIYSKKDEINKAIGKVLWGKNGKKYSLSRLMFALLKKKRKEAKKDKF